MKNLPLIVFIVLAWSSSSEGQVSTFGSDNGIYSSPSLVADNNALILPGEYLHLVQSQEFAVGVIGNELSRVATDSSAKDSLFKPTVRKLIPDNASWVERGLWGETGLFRKIGIASELTPETRKHELAVRRTMLTAHQIGGFVALGSMMTACYFGQKVIDGNAGYRSNHQLAVTASIISYSATGLLAVLSPPPFIRRDETSTTTIHKELAWVHFAGMVLTPILGSMISRRNYDGTARFHQISAYITTAAMAASMITVTF